MSCRGPFATDAYLETASPPVTAAPFTIAFWAHPLSLDDGYALYLSDTAATNDRFSMSFGSGADFYCPIEAGGTMSWTLGPHDYVINEWHHYALVEAAINSHSAVIDGVFGVKQVGVRVPAGIDNLAIGTLKDTGVSSPFNGYLAWVSIWSVALTAAELLVQSQGVLPWKIRPESLVSCWPVWGLHSPEIDLTGDHSLSLTGVPALVENGPPVAPFSGGYWNSRGTAAPSSNKYFGMPALSEGDNIQIFNGCRNH